MNVHRKIIAENYNVTKYTVFCVVTPSSPVEVRQTFRRNVVHLSVSWKQASGGRPSVVPPTPSLDAQCNNIFGIFRSSKDNSFDLSPNFAVDSWHPCFVFTRPQVHFQFRDRLQLLTTFVVFLTSDEYQDSARNEAATPSFHIPSNSLFTVQIDVFLLSRLG
jgi:hypothetical protein